MRIYRLTKNAGCLACLILLSAILINSPVKAQIDDLLKMTPLPVPAAPVNPEFDFLISWRAINYVPADYKGKILASKNSDIEISFDLLNKGKFIDISGQKIEWRLNNDFLKSGAGLKTIKFTAVKNRDQFVEISIPDYKDSKYKITNLGAVITIPLSSPEIVINTPYPKKKIGIGENLFRALPYFFNIADISQLKIDWNIDGLKPVGQINGTDILRFTASTKGQAAEGANVSIAVSAKNPADQLEFAQSYINLDIK